MRERLRAAAKALRVFAVSVVQIALSPLLLAVRAIVRLLLLSLAMWSIGLPVLGFFWLLHWWPVVSEHLSEPYPSMLMKVAAVALGAGLLSSLLKVGFAELWRELREIFGWVYATLRLSWWGGWKVFENLAAIWRTDIATGLDYIIKAARSSVRLGIILALLVLESATFHAIEEQRDNSYVAVVGADRIDNEEVKKGILDGVTFSLVHLENAQPKSGEGICLKESHREFLDVLREAFVECIELEKTHGVHRNDGPTFQVHGFASIAPVRPGALVDDDASDRLNCEIANLRAHAVAAFLAHGDDEAHASKWRCPAADGDSQKGDGTQKGDYSQNIKCLCNPPCSNWKGEYKSSASANGPSFKVSVNEWTSPEEMKNGKPANDGKLPENRRFFVETLNRSVHILLPDEFCQV